MSMLMRFDPFRDFDRVLEQAVGVARPSSMPMDAYRQGDRFIIHLDLPGVDPASIDVSIQKNVLSITAERHWQPAEGDQIVANERQQGSLRRELFLGENLDAERIDANYDYGVLTVTIPVAEQAKPRKISVSATAGQQAITANAN